jgi:hypothetical protein
MNYYLIEQTDTFGGEANYSYVRRSIIRGKSPQGAVARYARLSGLYWHNVGRVRYDSQSGSTCLFIDEVNSDNAHWNFAQDDRVKA